MKLILVQLFVLNGYITRIFPPRGEKKLKKKHQFECGQRPLRLQDQVNVQHKSREKKKLIHTRGQHKTTVATNAIFPPT